MRKDPEATTIERPAAAREERLDSDGLEISLMADSGPVPFALQDDAPLVGERFGKYLLIGELATGGMAEVALGVQRGIEGFLKVVTVKRMLPHLNNSPEFVSMFVDEARLGARLEHPNIVRVYEFGEHNGQYFTVMEYLPGEDVTTLLNRAAKSREPLPLNLAVHVIHQVCSGLHFAHELTDPSGEPLGLVHRDVNPSNVIITYGGEVKIIDFGVAKAATNSSHTLAGTIKGKLAYMSPEQVAARPIDRRSDVFSTGVMLWELLTAKPLFRRDTEASTLYALMNDPIPPVRQHRPDCPRELDAMVARSLARNPDERFDSCEAMQFALESFMGTLPKIDRRTLAKSMEVMFGSRRASAKLSIAQTRSLSQNVSLVMKLRTDVKRDLAETLDAITRQGRPSTELPVAGSPARQGRNVAVGVAILALLGLGVGAFVAFKSSDGPAPRVEAVAHATLEVSSDPPGAAIFIGGEPTGMKTPAKLPGLTPGNVELRLELAGHKSVSEVVQVVAGETTSRKLQLDVLVGRLVLRELPTTATVWVDGEERLLGEVITLPVGRHEVRIDIDGKPFVTQALEMTVGDQVWLLQDDKLVREDKE